MSGDGTMVKGNSNNKGNHSTAKSYSPKSDSRSVKQHLNK